jgi:hypothetical protein
MANSTTTQPSSTACATKALYGSLPSCSGQTYLSGLRRRVYFVEKSKILIWPKLPDADKAASMAAMSTYVGNFTLAADVKWHAIDGLTAKDNVTSESQGTLPYKTTINKLNVSHPGKDEDATGFARQANTDNLIYLAQQANGKFRVIGCELYDTETKVSQKSGEGPTGDAGTTIEVDATDRCPAPFYPGKIETEDGNISGVDGSAYVEPPASTGGGTTSSSSTGGDSDGGKV